MRKRLLSMLLALCFVLTLLPITAAAANATSVYVGGVELDSTTSYLVNGAAAGSGTLGSDGCNAYYNAGTGTLTLSGANLVGTAGSMYRSAAIYAYGDLNIVLVGDNTATGADDATRSSYGVYIELGALNISGSGSLAAAGGTAGNGNSYGIYAGTTITINAGTVTATGGTATNISSGISTYISVIVSGTASVTAVGGTGSQSHGVDCGATVSGGKLVAIGGKATGGLYGYGICDSTTYTGGLLVAKGQAGAARFEVKDNSGSTVAPLTGAYNLKFAVWGPTDTYTVLSHELSNLTNDASVGTETSESISSGYHWNHTNSTLTLKNVIVNAPDGVSSAYGINMQNAEAYIVLEGVNVVSAGNQTAGNSSGIYGSGSVTISGDTLITLGGSTSGGSSYGISFGGISLNAGTVIAISGSATSSYSCTGLYGNFSTKSITINGGNTIAIGGFAGNSRGMFTNGDINITGGNTIAIGGSGTNSYGLQTSTGKIINITGGSGVAIAGSATTAKALDKVPQGDAEHVPALTAGAWGGKMAAWKTKTPQTITFNNPGAQNFRYDTLSLSASAAFGLLVTFTSANTDVATITSDGVLTFVSAGEATITAHQAGNDTYATATEVSQTFTVNAVVPGAPTIGTATAGDTQASVSFTAPAFNGGTAITGYTVTSSPGGFTGSGAGSPITVTGLTNGVSYTFTVTATNSVGTGAASAATNSITPAATQTITFINPGEQTFGTTPTLTATSDSGLTVTFTSSTPDVATITPEGVLTFVSAGTATIAAHQAGDGSYLAATEVSRSFTVNAVVPGAPTNIIATAGDSQATVSFSPPANTGGSAITSYTVTSSPGGFTGSGAGSPITVTGLTNGTAYTFTVTAANSAGTSGASAASNSVTPQAPPPSGGDGGGSYTPPAPVTQIYNGGSTSGANLERLVSAEKPLTVEDKSGAKLVFDTDALKGISGQTSGSVKVEMKDVSPVHQETLPGKLVFSLTVSSESETISNFGGAVTVSLPYELKEGEAADKVTVWHLASDGTMTEIPCTYDPVTKLAIFRVTHFSLYVVGVEAPWVNPFTDVAESDWFYAAVEFANRKALFMGTGEAAFSPNSPMTRAMIWTVLGRLDGQNLSGSGVFEAARGWAMGKGITDGTTPDGSITREQMVTILWRYAGSPKAQSDLSKFSDAGKVVDYAAPAMAWAVKTGILEGSNGALLPQDSATRAQVAAILQRFIEAAAK